MTDLMCRDSYYTFANDYSLEKEPKKINQKGLMMMLARVDKLKASKMAVSQLIELINLRKLKIKVLLREMYDGSESANEKIIALKNMYHELVRLSYDIVKRVANLQDSEALLKRPFVLEGIRYDYYRAYIP